MQVDNGCSPQSVGDLSALLPSNGCRQQILFEALTRRYDIGIIINIGTFAPETSRQGTSPGFRERGELFLRARNKSMKKSMFRIRSILFALVSSFCGAMNYCAAATISAVSCSTADVSSAIAVAANGDTVQIPNGSCTWTSGISTSKQITLQGTSVGGVTITHQAGANDLLKFTIGSSFRTTIANLRFMPGTGTGNYLTVDGTGLPPLLHDSYFNLPDGQLQHAVQWFVTGGVIWNTTFESTYNLAGSCGSRIGSESGSLVVKPKIGWDTASSMGMLDTSGDKNLYIEDSIFSNVGQSPDVDDNGRVVMRHNQFIGSSGVTHGTTSTYGGRHVELYDNSMTYPNTNRNLNRWFWFRAGTAVITGNSIQALSGPCYGNKDSFTFVVENAQRADGGHGCCTGYMCFHQPGSGSDGTSGHSNLSAGQSPNDTYQISDPVYIWGNSGTGNGISHVHLNEGQPLQCSGTYSSASFFVLNRDYFVDNGAKPGWARYTYPHPLRGAPALPAPQNLRVM